MNENEAILDNILGEVMDYIRQLKTRKSTFGGYDKEYVLYTIQEICNIYEKHITKIISENKEHLDMLSNEITELRKKNENILPKEASDPAAIEKANQAIADANLRIEAANAHVAKLQSLYEEAEAKVRDQATYIEQLKAVPAVTNQDPYYSRQSQDIIAEAKRNADDIIRRANEESDRLRMRARNDADVVVDARNTANEIIRRANEEAERLRLYARNEAESIIRERRAEIRAEERLHEELLVELKEKYVKYSDFFSKMLNGVREIEGDVDPMLKRHEEYKAENNNVSDKISQMPWNDDISNYRKNF